MAVFSWRPIGNDDVETYPCCDCRAGCDQAAVLGSRPGIGNAENAEGGNCKGNPFLSNIFEQNKETKFVIKIGDTTLSCCKRHVT